ncbi:MAG TPA: hypothetical protein VII47_09325 [Actinomycetota bacterium]|jgi:hypothetical protein
MRLWNPKTICILGSLALSAAVSATASARAGVVTAVRTVHARGAGAAASMNVLTLNDQLGIDNRISAYTGPTGRLVLTAPEGLGDPDGAGLHCSLDNARPGESSATQVSCAAGYIGAVVGDLGGGNDLFDADPDLLVPVGGVIDGQRRPLSGGPGRDRLVGGAAADLLGGGGGPDSLVGGAGADLLIGGPGADKLTGGRGRDFCRGAGGRDTAKACEIVRGVP